LRQPDALRRRHDAPHPRLPPLHGGRRADDRGRGGPRRAGRRGGVPLVRARRRRRAPRRRRRCPRPRPVEGELSDPTGAIRPAVEAALAVARAGLEADPVVPPPPGLGRYLRFARQTPASLKAVARIVERDEAFRARVAAAVDEATVGRAGWLWLTRPEGWEDELAAIEAEHAARRADEEEQRSEQEARRKLERAEAAASKARAEAERWRAEAERSRAALAAERRARQEAEARVRTLQASLDDLADDRAAVVRKLKEVEAQLVERATELKALRARRRELEAQLRELRAGGAPAGREGAARGDVTAAVRGADLGAVAEEVARAASGAAELAEALGALARALRPAGPAPPGDDEGPRPAPAPTGAAPAGGPGAAEDRPDEPAPVRRRPVPLPGGIFDDTVEAAEHLLR